MSENWKYLGVLLSGVAALITASVPIFSFLKETQNRNNTNIQHLTDKVKPLQLAIIKDPDGWVNLRSNPSIESSVLMKIENGYRVEILEKNKNWYKIKTSLGDVGYIYSDRLQLLK